MFEIVQAYIEQYALLPQSGVVVVAVSGGADSLCLLHLLHRLCGANKRYPAVCLHVAHLNHRLRGEASTQEAASVARLAETWGLPVTIGSTDVPALARAEKRSLEEAARIARYRFLREIARGQPIAIAHHADDQVETLLLHWLRGGGIASMIGLQPRQQDIVRPLLAVTHADTLAYCAEYGLSPLEDASNLDPRFLRNRIRHELLPLLEDMNPGFRATLLRNVEGIRLDVAWIEEQIDACWSALVSDEQKRSIRLRRGALLDLPLSLQRHLIRRVTARLYGGQSPLELRHYSLIEHLLHRNNKGRELTEHLPQGLRITCVYDGVRFERVVGEGASQVEQANSDEEAILPIPGSVAVPGTSWVAVADDVPYEVMQRLRELLRREDWQEVRRAIASSRYTVYLDRNSIGNTLRVRTRRPGDRIRPLGMASEKKVQDILVDKHIVHSEREQIPLFFTEQHCAWLAGVCIDDRVRLTTETQEIVRLSIVPLKQ
jgi:tRNA(Ile)-lysidine synthase